MNFMQKGIYIVGMFVVINATGKVIVAVAETIEKHLKEKSTKVEA